MPELEAKARIGSDPDRYAELAASLLDRGELGFAPPGASPTSVRGPVFPAWLALGMLASRSARWIGFWASLPGLAAAVAIAHVLSRSPGKPAALVGGLIAAAHPLSCFVSARLLPDEVYGALLAMGVLAGIASLRSGPGWAVAAGAAFAAASLTRLTALGVLAVLVVMGLAAGARARRAAIVMAIVAAIPIGGWAVRTTSLAGAPTIVESLAGYNYWLGETADRYGFRPGFAESRRLAHALMHVDPGFHYAALTPPEAHALDARLSRDARRSIREAPFHFAKRLLTGLLWYWIRGESVSRTIQYAAVALPVVVLGVLGFRSRPREVPMVLIVAVVLLHVVVYAALCPMARYSVQLYPWLSYLAGFALRSSSETPA